MLAMLALPAGAAAVNPPACDTSVYPKPWLVFDGTAYYFCTLTCAGAFARDPERFVSS